MNEIKKVVNENQSLTYDSLPVGSVVEYEGEEIPVGYEEVEDNKKILWTNSNPSSKIDTLNITLSSDDYDVIEWFYYINCEAPSLEMLSIRHKKGVDTRIMTPTSSGGIIFRQISYNSDESYSLSATQGQTVNNSLCIPIYVIGYKTGLFDEEV